MITIPNLQFSGDYAKFVENAEDPSSCISFYKGPDYFEDISVRDKFIRSVEQMVRTSDDYKHFIRWIKTTVGINFCQVSSSIVDHDEAGHGPKNTIIEMHHGPLFTLRDYVMAVLYSFLDQGKPVTTFTITDQVLEEHYKLHVQVVMLTKTNHEAVHNRDIFLNLRQGIGNISEFIKEYAPYFDDDQKYRIHRYIALCKDNDSYDNGILDVNDVEPFVPL